MYKPAKSEQSTSTNILNLQSQNSYSRYYTVVCFSFAYFVIGMKV
jgi:hypothetical protein